MASAKDTTSDINNETTPLLNKRKDHSSPANTKQLHPVSVIRLFRFASKTDIALIITGTACSILTGACTPVMTILFANIMGTIIKYQSYVDRSGLEFANHILNHESRKCSLLLFALGVLLWIFSFGVNVCWSIVAENQCLRIRKLYYTSILRQEIGWFDIVKAGELTSRIANDINQIQEGIGERMGFIFMNISTFTVGILVAFVRGWDIALVCFCVIPIIMFTGVFFQSKASKRVVVVQSRTAASGAVADEIISGIRTVMSFNAQGREIARYTKHLLKTYISSRNNGLIIGSSAGALKFLIIVMYTITIIYGSWCIYKKRYDVQDVINVLITMSTCGFSLSNVAPNMSVISAAQGSAANVFSIIDRQSAIDALDAGRGMGANTVRGAISIRDVYFSYPTRSNVQVLKGLTLDIHTGQKVALVGESGCGKSTVVSLIERFYDPEQGEVLIDGIDVKEYNIGALRSRISTVTQEPVLFSASVFQNVAWGAADLESNPPTEEEVIDACKAANAHQFITRLPDGYNTIVGEGGALLSGGQKQRIAIARAIIRKPDILLLDEATSALDTASERLVKDALDNLSSNRTTISIAHRLSTIRNCDQIYVVREGTIVEHGTHNELITMGGEYATMVRAQELRQSSHSSSKELAYKESDWESYEESGLKKLAGNEVNGDVIDARPFESTSCGANQDRISRQEPTASSKVKPDKAKEGIGLICLLKLIWLHRPSIRVIGSGSAASFIDGIVMPCFSLLYSHALLSLAIPDKDEMKRTITLDGLLFLVFAVAAFVMMLGRIGIFHIVGEAVKMNLQSKMLAAYLSFEPGYFDDDRNGTGNLTSQLASDPEDINKTVSSALSTFMSAFSTIICSMSIAFYYTWQLSLVLIGCFIAQGYTQYLQLKSTRLASIGRRMSYENSGRLAAEAIRCIKTVAALRLEETFIQLFIQSDERSHKENIKSSLYNGIGFGFSQATRMFAYALIFFSGSQLIIKGWMGTDQLTSIMLICAFSFSSVGVFAQMLPVVSKGAVAARGICMVLDRKSKIDGLDPTGRIPEGEGESEGCVDFGSISFRYPARPDTKILDDISLSAVAGKNVALVGASGSGKSTLISLAQRLYDTTSGKVLVEGLDVCRWNIMALRDSMSIVSQEPVLFNYTIAENISYGKPGATQKEIEDAAKEANIYEFVVGLPDGFDTVVGQRGGKLSGGQKQRIAIARALVRKPKLLLLDEATAALDSHSERVVQQVLDKASKDRTTITIAHRLSTIQNSDTIIVFKSGRIVERGTHDELLSNRGVYFTLVQQQSSQITH